MSDGKPCSLSSTDLAQTCAAKKQGSPHQASPDFCQTRVGNHNTRYGFQLHLPRHRRCQGHQSQHCRTQNHRRPRRPNLDAAVCEAAQRQAKESPQSEAD